MNGFRPEGKGLTVGISSACGMGFMLFGYDQGVFGGLLENDSFRMQFDYPDATIQGQIVSTYDLGCVAGAFMALFIGDILGRRSSIYLASGFLTIGGALQASSFTLSHMIVGRIVSGLGIGIHTTTIPMWQSETCKPEHRGKLVALQLTHLVFGFVLTNWMNFGFTYIPHMQVSWRFPLAFQCALAIGTAALLPFMVESPRWLCLKGRHSDARQAIARLLAKPPTAAEVSESLRIIAEVVSHEQDIQGTGWRELFAGGPQQTFRRIALGAGVNFMQQMGGINVIAYYLPVVLTRSFGFSNRMAPMLSAFDSMQWMFWAAIAITVIERVGRRRLLIFGAVGQSLCFSMATIGLGIGTYAMNCVAVAFIFLYYFFFGLSFLAIPFLYPSEINSHRSRNSGSSIAMITNWIFVYVVVSVTPVGIQNLQWRFYLIFAVTNAAFALICWYFYVETAGLSLEEVDKLFEIHYAGGSGMTYNEAAQQAKESHKLKQETIQRSKDEAGTHVEFVV